MARLKERDKRSLRRWMWGEARTYRTTRELFQELCRRLVAMGIPIERSLLSVRTIHPQIMATGYLWAAGRDVIAVDRGHDILNDDAYLNSPFKQLHEGREELRRRIADPDSPRDMAVVEDMRREGFTDYIAFTIHFTDGTRNAVSFGTKARLSFSDEHLDFLREILPLFALLIEIQAERRIATVLLDTYVGHQAGERILKGEIRRGAGQSIQAVIWYGDMRGFTAMSNSRPTEEVIDALNSYFDCMASAVHRHGGQVLKFIGDGMLAIFPLVDAAFRQYAARQALQAALEVKTGMDTVNETRRARQLPALQYGLGLHIGELIWGNIGAVDRLDFTAIGPSVNLTARLEELSASLHVPIVMSADFADAASDYLAAESLGEHSLRGLADPVEVFTVGAEALQNARDDFNDKTGPADRVKETV
ncbi:MAG: adenylate/guanylate cyclase domain-containing protein [Bauldia litoralis]